MTKPQHMEDNTDTSGVDADEITCSVSKATLSGSQNSSRNKLEVKDLCKVTHSHILQVGSFWVRYI